MLAHRIIPVLLQRGDMLVKGERFQSWRNVGHAEQAVRIHNARGVDELIYLDIAATPEGRGPDFAMVERLTAGCYMPITVGGGVRSIDDVRGLLNAGADKVAVCSTLARDGTHFIRQIADRWGSQSVVAAVDYVTGDRPCVVVACGEERVLADYDDGDCPMHPIEWAMASERAGAGEILLTSIDRDGTLTGYDVELIRQVSEAVDVPVIACGGCGTYEHMHEAIEAGASAVAAGAMFQWTDATPKGAAKYLASKGVEVRL